MIVLQYNEPQQEIYNNVVCATSKGSDQPGTSSLSLLTSFLALLWYNMELAFLAYFWNKLHFWGMFWYGKHSLRDFLKKINNTNGVYLH